MTNQSSSNETYHFNFDMTGNSVVATQAQHFAIQAMEGGTVIFWQTDQKADGEKTVPYCFRDDAFYNTATLNYAAEDFATLISSFNLDPNGIAVFGPQPGGLMLATAVGIQLSTYHTGPVSVACSLTVGAEVALYGADMRDKNVILLDYVADYEKLSQAAELIRMAGGTIAACVVIFDGQERIAGSDEDSNMSAAQKFEDTYGIKVHALCCLNEVISTFEILLFLTHPHEDKTLHRAILNRLLQYREKHCVRP